MDLTKMRKMIATNMSGRTPVKKGKKPRKGKKAQMGMMASMDEMTNY